MIVSPELYHEIEAKRQEIKSAPEKYLVKQEQMINQTLEDMGNTYLFWVGNPGLREACALSNKELKTLKKMTRQNVQAMHNAWYYLTTQRQGSQRISPQLLKATNALINRFDKSLGNYRNTEVFLNIPGYEPPLASEVPGKMDSCLERIAQMSLENPLEAAIYAHLSLVLIQPFDSANKRTARLVQDRLLTDSFLPPVIIAPGESKEYLQVISKVAPAYAVGDSVGQKPFYDYIAEKINLRLDWMKGGIN